MVITTLPAAWMGKVGDGLVDVGSPFGPGASISDDSGYSIIEALNLDAAKGITSGNPFFSEGKGNFSIKVLKLLPVPF